MYSLPFGTWGAEAWPPVPVTFMSRESLLAVTLPAEHPTVPDRAQFHKWAPYTSSMPSKGGFKSGVTSSTVFLGNLEGGPIGFFTGDLIISYAV